MAENREYILHCAIVAHLRLFARPDWLWWHSANGEKRDIKTAVRLKRMGVKPGVPDLVMIDPNGLMHSMEIKDPDGGRLSDAQKAWIKHCEDHALDHVVVDSLQAAIDALNGWGCLTKAVRIGS